MSEQEERDREGCILFSRFLDSGSLFSLLSATILVHSFGFEELNTGGWFAGVNKAMVALFWVG